MFNFKGKKSKPGTGNPGSHQTGRYLGRSSLAGSAGSAGSAACCFQETIVVLKHFKTMFTSKHPFVSTTS
jgi:hypothetical protein